MEKVTLETLHHGAVLDLFNVEYEKLLSNISDENTSPTAVRSITIKIDVKPSKTRREAAVSVSASSRLAPIKPAETAIFFDLDEDGSLAAYEDNPEQIPLDFQSGAVNTIGG